MADTIFTRALGQAAQLQGSTQALASALRVPEGTLLRWMAGRAQMPVRAFHELVDLLLKHEMCAEPAEAPAAGAANERVGFRIGELAAQCPRCRGVEFLASGPAASLCMTSPLTCAGCAQAVQHGDLLRALATRSITESRSALARKNHLPATSEAIDARQPHPAAHLSAPEHEPRSG